MNRRRPRHRRPSHYSVRPGSSIPNNTESKNTYCAICKERFDTLLFAVNVKQGKAHPVCAGLKAIGLEKLATTSGR